jgi:hypothetical protein
MLRLELAAKLADRTAEIEALETEARLEAGPDDAPLAAGEEASAAHDEPSAEPATAAPLASTWAELDEAGAGEPPTSTAGPAATASPESEPEDPAASAPGAGPGTSPESPEHHA